jgi:hypothetical protein
MVMLTELTDDDDDDDDDDQKLIQTYSVFGASGLLKQLHPSYMCCCSHAIVA